MRKVPPPRATQVKELLDRCLSRDRVRDIRENPNLRAVGHKIDRIFLHVSRRGQGGEQDSMVTLEREGYMKCALR